MNLGSTGRRSAIESALLDYHRAPGRYALAQRQPRVLFASVKEVLQLASGRSPDGDQSTGSPAPVRQAACFFIRSALLNPDADHYTLLGVTSDADAPTLKERYRLMMRLMHPDFSDARAGPVWPADAATRVNQAYEVLSSSPQRRSYDEQLGPRPQARTVGAPGRTTGGKLATVPRTVAAAKPVAEDPRRRLKRLATAFGAAGGVAMLAAWFAGGQSERETLVQRASAPSLDTALAQAVMSARLPSPVALLPPSEAALPAAAIVRPTLPESSAAAPPPRIEPPPAVSAPASPLTPTQARNVELTPPIAVQPPIAMPTAMGAAPVAVAPPAVQALPPPPLAVATARPSPTLSDVHYLLSKLLQEIESGWGDRLLSQLDREAQSEPGAQALLRRYNSVVDGMRPVKLSNVQFKAEPRDGRLLVTGRVTIQVRDASVPLRELAMQAEFASRDGTFVMTRLAQAQE